MQEKIPENTNSTNKDIRPKEQKPDSEKPAQLHVPHTDEKRPEPTSESAKNSK